MKRNNGITLIVLAVTVVVLTILSGVAINGALGDGGLISKTKNEKNTSRIKLIDEAIQSYNLENKLGQTDEDIAEVLLRKDLINEAEKDEIDETDRLVIGDQTILVRKRTSVDEESRYNSTIDGRSPHSYNPIIPKGYTPINEGEAQWGDGTTNPAKDSVDHGLVIKDKNDNEWVWIPVDSIMLYKYLESGTALSGDVGVNTQYYSNTMTIGREGDSIKVARSMPNSTAWREPDLVSGYDKNSAFYATTLGFSSVKNMAEEFVNNYANMIKSIKEYGGFYIGRYEISNEGVQRGKTVITNQNWYSLYKSCTGITASENVESEMIWGIQWDLACDFISKKGDKKSITDSRSWGNYWDSTGNAAVMEGTTKIYSIKQVTGYSEYWKANNIYDFAGNCWEWTQEADQNTGRGNRGGCSGYLGAVVPASIQQWHVPDDSSSDSLTARAVLVVK